VGSVKVLILQIKKLRLDNEEGAGKGQVDLLFEVVSLSLFLQLSGTAAKVGLRQQGMESCTVSLREGGGIGEGEEGPPYPDSQCGNNSV
jgi:hypothetical protein